MENTLKVIRPVAREREWVNTKDFNKDRVGGSNAGKTTIVAEPSGTKGTFGIEFDMTQEELQQFQRDLGYSGRYGENYLNLNFNNPFWVDYRVVLLDEPNVFDVSIPEQKLKFLVAKSSTRVASSFDEINGESLFYIEDTEEKVKSTVKKAELKQKAYELLGKLSEEQKVKILKVFGEDGTVSSPEKVKARLFEILEDNPAKFISACELKKEKLAIKNLVFDLINNGVIREKAGYLYDIDVNLGTREDFEFMLGEPKNGEMINNYKERLELFNKR